MLTSLALIWICGLSLGSIFKKIKLPGLLGMLLTGIILGPFVLNWLSPEILAISPDLREFALVIILIRAGLSLDLSDLKAIGRPAILMSFIPACFEMLGTILIAPRLFDIPLLDAAIMAAVISSASPAVIVPRMLNLMETGYGTNKKIPQMVLAGDSVDDVFNILVFTSLIGLASGDSVSVIRFLDVPISILTGIVVGILVGFFLAFLFKKIALSTPSQILMMLSASFLLVELENLLEGTIAFSGLLAVMVAGIVLFEKIETIAKEISGGLSKLWIAAEVLLFALVGSTVDVSYIPIAGIKTIFLLISVFLIRGIGILLCLVKTNLNWKERLFCIFTGFPKATVQAALGGIPLAMGLPNGELILAVAVIAILFSAPVGAFMLDISYKKLLTKNDESL